jgi:hypothetical protein
MSCSKVVSPPCREKSFVTFSSSKGSQTRCMTASLLSCTLLLSRFGVYPCGSLMSFLFGCFLTLWSQIFSRVLTLWSQILPQGGRQTVGVIRDRSVHRYNSTLLLRRGKEPKGPFEELLPPHCLLYYYCNYLFYLFYYKAASKETTVT